MRSASCFSLPPRDAALSPHRFDNVIDDAFRRRRPPLHQTSHDPASSSPRMVSLAHLFSVWFRDPCHVP